MKCKTPRIKLRMKKKKNKNLGEPVFCHGLVCWHWPVWRFQSKHALRCLHSLPIILCQHRDLEKCGNVPIILQGCQTSFLPNQIIQYQTWQRNLNDEWIYADQFDVKNIRHTKYPFRDINKSYCNQKLQEQTLVCRSLSKLSNLNMWIKTIICSSHYKISVVSPILWSSEQEAKSLPEITNNVARLIPAYSFGCLSKPFLYLQQRKF